MRRADLRITWMLGSAIALFLGAGTANAATCASLTGKMFGSATITAATDVKPPFTVTGLPPQASVSVGSSFCRVQGAIAPAADSDIKFEIWLPPSNVWNGKYQGVGNGAFAGSPLYAEMSWALKAGYAVSATDTGHAAPATDARWALGHPEKVADYGWRSIHETAVASKAIVKAFYEKAPGYSYFNGCSNGGRQALVEAQRFPEDYDGIVAGAPALYFAEQTASAIWIKQALTAEPGSWLSPADLTTVTKATLAACRAKDGILDNPSQCKFDPAKLLCKPGQSGSCLTSPQITALKKIYSGPRDAAGNSLFPGYSQGGEAGQPGWSLWLTGTEPNRVAGSILNAIGTGFFGNMVYDNPQIDIGTLNFADALAAANAKAGAALYSANPDLSAFRARGGKIIGYHGWSDQAIPPGSSIRYYEAVASRMGGIEDIKSFYRLFMAPGMEHCSRGPGPDAIGGLMGLPSPSQDPSHDVVSALANWVENGVAPKQITATKYRENDPSKGIAAKRSWRLYPELR